MCRYFDNGRVLHFFASSSYLKPCLNYSDKFKVNPLENFYTVMGNFEHRVKRSQSLLISFKQIGNWTLKVHFIENIFEVTSARENNMLKGMTKVY